MNNNTIFHHNSNKREKLPPRININNEIKISQDTDVHFTIDFIYDLFINQKYKTIIICGLSKAITKVVLIAEIIKLKVKGLHQINKIDCLNINKRIDDSGKLDERKMVPRMEIRMTFIEPNEKEKENMGYQKPTGINSIKYYFKLNNLVANLLKKDGIKHRRDLQIGLRRYYRVNKKM